MPLRMRLMSAGALALVAAGCANALFGVGDLLGGFSEGIDRVEECASSLDPADLNDVFELAVPVQWNGDSVELTDAAQEDLGAFYAEHLGEEVFPAHFLNERYFRLGPLVPGEVIEVELLSDVVSDAWLYDAELTIAGGQTHDLDGSRRRLTFHVARDNSVTYLRINLYYLSRTGEPIVRLTRKTQEPGPPLGQAVVLDFSGRTGLTFRTGTIKPTDIGPVDDALVRERALAAFRATFEPYNLTMLTDADPPPEAPFSVIYIGPANPPIESLGLAEVIDYPNAIPDDIAVVDTNSGVLQAARLLGPETFGTALGKVAAHEMGHLLGLHHVSDPDALMTGAGCQGIGIDPQRMFERGFKRGPVWSFSSDFSIGYQDAQTYLLAVLGQATAPP